MTHATLNIGIGKTEITPPVPLGIPSAGYRERKGAGMEGVHDPLFATALFITNGNKQLVLCSVDNLLFPNEIVQEIEEEVLQLAPQLRGCEMYIGATHTHSGGGGHLNVPLIGESIAGPYHNELATFYAKKTAEAIIQASQRQGAAKVGIGYGKAESLNKYRGLWPSDITPPADITLIKVVQEDGTPLAILFNYAVHPTILKSQNRLFSADFVGYTRDHLSSLLGPTVQPLYFNGAQGDVNPVIFNTEDRFTSCKLFGQLLAEKVKSIWDATEASDVLEVMTEHTPYLLKPQPNPFGLHLPIEQYQTEMNVIILNKLHAFITIPGELSCLYDHLLQEKGKKLGYSHVSILGLTNGGHGYIISPDSWEHKTFESRLSLGGKYYGEFIQNQAEALLIKYAP